MKALTLRQPWAWMVVHGGKLIENRTWNTSFRGRFLIHAAKGMTTAEYVEAELFGLSVNPKMRLPTARDLRFGGIVGMAAIEGVQEPDEWEPGDWHMSGQYGFLLRDVRPLPFVPCRGMLGFWEVPRAVLDRLRLAG